MCSRKSGPTPDRDVLNISSQVAVDMLVARALPSPPKPLPRDVAGYFNRLLGGEHFSRRNFHLQRPPQKLEQHSDPFSCRQQLGDEHLESPKRSFYESNRLANFWGGIDSDDFLGARL